MSSQFYFWLHFILVTFSHFLVGILGYSMVYNFIRSDAKLIDRLRRFAMIFFLTVIGVNHVTNVSSKCIITTLENEARIKEGKEAVGEFLPRYYDVFKGEW